MDKNIELLQHYLKLFAQKTGCDELVVCEIEALCDGLADTLNDYQERIAELETQIDRLAEGKSVSLY